MKRNTVVDFIELYQKTLASSAECLVDYLQKIVYLYEKEGKILSLILLDIDNMKQINREFGYQYGNYLLLRLSKVIASSIRKSDMAGKYKGSSFLIVLPDCDAKGAKRVAQRIRNKIRSAEPSISMTIGVYSFVPDGHLVEKVLELVEARVAEAKAMGGNQFLMIEDEAPRRIVDYQTLLKTLSNKSVEPAFQPIYDLNSGRIAGYEVLMRLVKEDGRVLPASFFIQDLMKTSLISPFEEIVLQKALLKYTTLGLEGRLYVNFPYNIFNFIAKGRLKVVDFYREVVSYGVEPSRVVLEISEGKLAGSTEDLVELIKEVRSYNFCVAIDDFGVEHSSVERLIKTKPDVVKLDGFFLREAPSMLKWVVLGLKKMGFKVLAEQVESEEDFRLVKSLKVDMAQGFYLGRPKLL